MSATSPAEPASPEPEAEPALPEPEAQPALPEPEAQPALPEPEPGPSAGEKLGPRPRKSPADARTRTIAVGATPATSRRPRPGGATPATSRRPRPGGEIRVEVTPPWPFRLRARSSLDGLTRVRNGVIHRLLHVDQRPHLVRIAQLSSGNVLFGATHPDAIARMRRALWVDLDLAPFHARFKDDPWIGAAVRSTPTLRPMGRPSAFEALVAAITEQLIESERAALIQRRIHTCFGATDEHGEAGAALGNPALSTGLRDCASPRALAGAAPARLESFDLAGRRALTLIRAARQVAAGRIDLEDPDPAAQARSWHQLKAIPNIGAWTVEMTALVGQNRIDQVPAADLGFIKLAGRVASGGDPRARGSEEDVRALFERFGEWKGIAGAYALRSAGFAKNAMLA